MHSGGLYVFKAWIVRSLGMWYVGRKHKFIQHIFLEVRKEETSDTHRSVWKNDTEAGRC
jgi:lipoprotein NlpI